MGRQTIRLLSGVILIAGLVSALLLFRRLIDKERQELQANSETQAQDLAMQLRSGILQSVGALQDLAKWWLSQGKPLDLEDWRKDGQLFLTRSPGLQRAIWIGRDDLQHWSAAPGFQPDLRVRRPEPHLSDVIAEARSTRAAVISPVFDLDSDRSAFYACIPVAGLKDQFIAGLFDPASLVASLRKARVPPELRIAVETGGHTVYSDFSERLSSDRAAAAPFDVASVRWAVSIAVPQRHFAWFTGQIFAILCIIGALLYSCGILLYLSYSRSSALERANAEVRQLNRTLNRQIADFRTLLDVIPIGIAVAHDPECRTVTVNPALAALSGAQPATAGTDSALPYRLMRNGRELEPQEFPMRVAALTGETVRADEDQIIRDDGRVIDVLSFASPLFDENGQVRGVISACVDITDRKAQEQLRADLERRLHRDERMRSLGVMAAGIAHDFNNLLTAIIGEASLAARECPVESDVYRHLGTCLEASHGAAAVVRQVMAYTGQRFHSLLPTDLSTILHSCAARFPGVVMNLAAELPAVIGDGDEIQQAVENLLSNALESTEDARVHLNVDTCLLSEHDVQELQPAQNRSPGLYVRVVVADNGRGMPAEVAEHAFDPFFSTKFLGRGLGLSEVLGIMRSHHGAVRLRSAPDAGTTVELFFPAASSSEVQPHPARLAS
jgi:PAS domain S-box-containing protein